MQVSLARLTTAAQFGVIGVAVFGDQIFPYLDMEPPALYVANRDRRVSVCLGTRSHLTCIEVLLRHTVCRAAWHAAACLELQTQASLRVSKPLGD